MKNHLRLTLTRDDDRTAELHADVFANGFSGRGSAWFNVAHLIAFSKELETYPLPSGGSSVLAGGFWDKQAKGKLKQVHFSLRAYPIGNTGQLGVRVRVATPVHDCDRSDSQHLAEVEIETRYMALQSFGKGLRALAKGEADEAVLEGDPV